MARVDLFTGDDETSAAHRGLDWASTSLGPVESWPVELRSAVRTVMPSQIPMLLWWGPDLVQIFNHAYMPVLGDKFPAAVGQPGSECWAEVWDELAPLADRALSGRATYSENLQLLLRRHGYLEETYWTFSYSPVHAEDGGVVGIFVATTDVTARVLSERRLESLHAAGHGDDRRGRHPGRRVPRRGRGAGEQPPRPARREGLPVRPGRARRTGRRER